VSDHDDAYAQKNGHPPSAAKTVCIDFDGVILPWGPLMGHRRPFAGAKEALEDLRAKGYRIVILTSRLSPEWWDAEAASRGVNATDFGTAQARFLLRYLARWGLPYDRVTAQKVPALAYFDDRAIRVPSESCGLLDAVDDFVLAEERKEAAP
jgi:hypothetical protein